MKLVTKLTRRAVFKGSALLSVTAVAGLGAQSAQAQNKIESAPYGLPISSEFPFEKKRLPVNGSTMAYIDEGEGQPILFLHGNPTSSYLWRNIIPYVTGGYRAIAPDLIGMGDSGKPDIDYTFKDHAAYLDAFIDALGLKDVILVVHDWGSALGMRYARMNPKNVKAVAFMEAIVHPAVPAQSATMPKELVEFFALLRSDQGAKMVLEDNFFVETILPKMGVLREMTEPEMAAYRKPFPTPQSRKPTLQWPREVPIDGMPASTTAEVSANGDWLYKTQIPKLLFYATPGALGPKQVVDYMTAKLSNLEVRHVGAGAHYVQEDHPHLIGQGLADWLRRL